VRLRARLAEASDALIPELGYYKFAGAGLVPPGTSHSPRAPPPRPVFGSLETDRWLLAVDQGVGDEAVGPTTSQRYPCPFGPV